MAYNVPFNPYGSMQQFPQVYQQQYQMMQQQPQQIQQEAYLCRPVTSREEAVATPVDYMRPILLPDMGHGKIYLKRFNPQTGASDILEFVQCQEQEQTAQKYATVEDLEALKNEIEKMKRRTERGKRMMMSNPLEAGSIMTTGDMHRPEASTSRHITMTAEMRLKNTLALNGIMGRI